jgi:hypothetical protein
MPVQHRSVDVLVHADRSRRVVPSEERDLFDAIWDETVNEILNTGVQRCPRHHPSTSCSLRPVAGHAADVKADVAVSWNDPHIADRCQGPPGQGRIESKAPDHATVEHLPPTFRYLIGLDLAPSQDREALGLLGRHHSDLRSRLLMRMLTLVHCSRAVSHETHMKRAMIATSSVVGDAAARIRGEGQLLDDWIGFLAQNGVYNIRGDQLQAYQRMWRIYVELAGSEQARAHPLYCPFDEWSTEHSGASIEELVAVGFHALATATSEQEQSDMECLVAPMSLYLANTGLAPGMRRLPRRFPARVNTSSRSSFAAGTIRFGSHGT